jgi:NAD(P)-dependent dehydrogenase (short-subunit alcohol dehydrogenase family)
VADSVLKDRVAVITGASSGIGRELARRMAAAGARLSLAARDEERLETVMAECLELGTTAIAVPADVGDPDQCASLIRKTVERFGGLDVLVNNAGLSMWAEFEKIEDLTIFERIMRVNYLGSVYCTFHALPHLKQSRGRIVGISSLTGKTGVPTRTGYAASKHAMAGFFDSLRIEVAPYGISVTMVYPGFVATEVRERAFGSDGRPLGRSTVQEDKVMTVETCARLILRATERRKRELVMTFRGRAGLWLKLVSPGLVDRIANRAIRQGR